MRVVARAVGAAGQPLFDPDLTWTVSGPGDVNDGWVTANGPGTLTVRATAGAASGTATIAAVAPPEPSRSWILVDDRAPLQEMTGWEVTAQVGQLECDPDDYAAYRDSLYDRAVEELGVNRVRIELRANAEHPVDFTKKLISGEIDFQTWADKRYVSRNDDSDPAHASEAGFHMTELDHQVEHVVRPLETRLRAAGEALYVNLTFVAFGAKFHRDHPHEYAELILVAFQHLKARHGLVPDALEVILEPDVAGWSERQVLEAVRAVGPRLEAAGYEPAIIAPSNTSMSAAVDFYRTLAADETARRYVTDFAYHRYRGVARSHLETIGALPDRFGVRTGMLEHIGSDGGTLHEDLEIGRGSAWQQFALAFCGKDAGAIHYVAEGSSIRLGARSRELPQYFREVRLGARRYFASSDTELLRPLAFRNRGGLWTVIVRSSGAARFSIAGLSPGRYESFLTTEDVRAQPGETIVLEAGEPLSAALPAAGVITLYQAASDPS